MGYSIVKDESIIKSVFECAEQCYLALLDGSKMKMFFSFFGYKDGDLYLYFIEDKEVVDLIKTNNNVSFFIETPSVLDFNDVELGSNEAITIQGQGKATVLKDIENKCRGLMNIKQQYLSKQDCSKMDPARLQEIDVIKIEIEDYICKEYGLDNSK